MSWAFNSNQLLCIPGYPLFKLRPNAGQDIAGHGHDIAGHRDNGMVNAAGFKLCIDLRAPTEKLRVQLFTEMAEVYPELMRPPKLEDPEARRLRIEALVAQAEALPEAT